MSLRFIFIDWKVTLDLCLLCFMISRSDWSVTVIIKDSGTQRYSCNLFLQQLSSCSPPAPHHTLCSDPSDVLKRGNMIRWWRSGVLSQPPLTPQPEPTAPPLPCSWATKHSPPHFHCIYIAQGWVSFSQKLLVETSLKELFFTFLLYFLT